MTDWNPLDPDYENVFYDLSSWSIDLKKGILGLGILGPMSDCVRKFVT